MVADVKDILAQYAFAYPMYHSYCNDDSLISDLWLIPSINTDIMTTVISNAHIIWYIVRFI